MTTAPAFITATWFPTVEYTGYNESEGQNSIDRLLINDSYWPLFSLTSPSKRTEQKVYFHFMRYRETFSTNRRFVVSFSTWSLVCRLNKYQFRTWTVFKSKILQFLNNFNQKGVEVQTLITIRKFSQFEENEITRHSFWNNSIRKLPLQGKSLKQLENWSRMSCCKLHTLLKGDLNYKMLNQQN